MRALAATCLIVLSYGLLPLSVMAQLDGVLQVNADLHRFLERQQVRGLLPDAHLSHEPLSAYAARTYLDSLALLETRLTAVDRRRLAWYRGTAPGPGAGWARDRWGVLYPDGESLFALLHDDYAVRLEPLLYTGIGPARRTRREGRDPSLFAWEYARGARLSGHIGDHVFFEARLTENRLKPIRPSFAGGTAPRRGFVTREGEVLDYFDAAGIIGFRSRYFEARFGRDRNRWGVGLGSLVLSNYAAPYDFLQLRTTLGRFQYVNLFAGLTDRRLDQPVRNLPRPRKYAAMHRLAVALPGRVQVGVFEAVTFASDTLGARRGFDVSYLNPLIFYRAVERDRGSPDNVVLGGDVAWIPVSGIRLYGQFLLDELKVDQIGDGWWGNKWGWILGADVADFPLRNLTARLEFARLRPFLYSHRSAATTYVHYGDVLGHPVGPNAWDALLHLRYHPTARIHGTLTVSRTERGRNADSLNVGADPNEPYTSRFADTGIALLDGVRQTEWLVEASAGYELLPRLHLELGLRSEATRDAEHGTDRYLVPLLQVRWGMPPPSVRY